mgnify:CR=1 FL=1
MPQVAKPTRFLQRVAEQKVRTSKPMSIVFPDDLQVWLKDVSRMTGTPVSRVVIEAVRRAREEETAAVMSA